MATVVVAPRSHRSKEIRRHTLIYLGLTPFLVLAVFPIFWMAITAIKQDSDLYLVDAVPFWFQPAADVEELRLPVPQHVLRGLDRQHDGRSRSGCRRSRC